MRFEPGGLRDRTEADHLNKCPVCGALLDMRDMAQVLALSNFWDGRGVGNKHYYELSVRRLRRTASSKRSASWCRWSRKTVRSQANLAVTVTEIERLQALEAPRKLAEDNDSTWGEHRTYRSADWRQAFRVMQS
jgi:hypothetical protein